MMIIQRRQKERKDVHGNCDDDNNDDDDDNDNVNVHETMV